MFRPILLRKCRPPATYLSTLTSAGRRRQPMLRPMLGRSPPRNRKPIFRSSVVQGLKPKGEQAPCRSIRSPRMAEAVFHDQVGDNGRLGPWRQRGRAGRAPRCARMGQQTARPIAWEHNRNKPPDGRGRRGAASFSDRSREIGRKSTICPAVPPGMFLVSAFGRSVGYFRSCGESVVLPGRRRRNFPAKYRCWLGASSLYRASS